MYAGDAHGILHAATENSKLKLISNINEKINTILGTTWRIEMTFCAIAVIINIKF